MFLLSHAVLTGQVWLCGSCMDSVLSCPEPLLANHFQGSCFIKIPLLHREEYHTDP